MSTHLQQKLALVTSQIHASASWVSVYDGINHLDMYIKEQAAWKMLFLSFLNDLSLKQNNFVLQMCIIYRDRSRTPAASNTLLWQELTGSSRHICCQKKLHIRCCRRSRPASELCRVVAIAILNVCHVYLIAFFLDWVSLVHILQQLYSK